MAAPTAAKFVQPTEINNTAVGAAWHYQQFDAGSDTLFFAYPSRRIVTTVDMVVKLTLQSGDVVTVNTIAGAPEELSAVQLWSTGSTLNSGIVKVYQ
jgi:hypothetical protein